MTPTELQFDGTRVRVRGREWIAEHTVHDACIVGDVVILIYDYMSGPRHRQFQNAEGFSVDGQKLWKAEHPTSETADAYVNVVSREPLVLWNFACFLCTIDPASGKLLAAEFTK